MQFGYDSVAVANFFLGKWFAKIDPMKLSKLVYISHGYSLAILNKPLINEPIMFWQFGPSIISLYNTFAAFGNKPIASYVEISFTNGKFLKPSILESDVQTADLLDKVWATHKKFTNIQLANFCHMEGTPWSQMQNEGYNLYTCDTVIHNERIRQWFLSYIEMNKNGKAI